MSDYYIYKSGDSDSVEAYYQHTADLVKRIEADIRADQLFVVDVLKRFHEQQAETKTATAIDWEARAAAAEQQLATVTAERDMLARELQAKHGVAEDAYSATLAAARAISIMQSVHRLR